jgi:hypothetical protein
MGQDMPCPDLEEVQCECSPWQPLLYCTLPALAKAFGYPAATVQPDMPVPLCCQWCACPGSNTILTLQLQQSVLPQYGPDFKSLRVLVEPQTPQRLHVKISPTSSSKLSSAGLQEGAPSATTGTRWEVPEWLIPRWAGH